MQRLILLLGFLLALIPAQKHPPALTQEQMIALIVDLELTQAMVQHYAPDAATADQLLKENILQVYQAHDTSEAIFQESFQYYLTPTERWQEIQEGVLQRLEALQDQAR